MRNKLDLKTLQTIYTLCSSGSVTNAARILGVSPGNISYIINKARKITGDSLFFRTKNGMSPGRLAVELSETYEQITKKIDVDAGKLEVQKTKFIISTHSLLEFILSQSMINGSSLTTRLEFRSISDSENERVNRLRNKEIDIDIGTKLPADKSLIQIKFFHSDIAVVARLDHPSIAEPFTMDDWNRLNHAIWAKGMHMFSDNIEQASRFNEIFERRNVAFVASSTLNLVMLCLNSEIIILLPTLIARKIEPILPIKVLSVPPELNMNYECYLHYHKSIKNNPYLTTLVNNIQEMLVKS